MGKTEPWAKGLLIGLAALALNAGIKAMVGNTGSAAGSSELESFTHEELEEMQAGFKEVSPGGLPGWTSLWRDSSEATMRAHSARAMIYYGTAEELIQMFRMRARVFRAMATEPGAASFCFNGALSEASIDYDRLRQLGFEPPMKVVGRVLARAHEGRARWASEVDLQSDEQVWEQFANHLIERGKGNLVDDLVALSESRADQETACNLQADLYRLAVTTPNEPVGPTTLLGFVRSMEALGLETYR